MTVATVANLREMISTDLFGRLVGRVAEGEQVDRERAERVVEQTLAFLAVCTGNRGTGLAPTKAVDAGWHAFILHTEDYAEFCERIAGRFIHHRPRHGEDDRLGVAVIRTIGALREAGYPVDEELWRVDPADCNQCHAGCHDSP